MGYIRYMSQYFMSLLQVERNIFTSIIFYIFPHSQSARCWGAFFVPDTDTRKRNFPKKITTFFFLLCFAFFFFRSTELFPLRRPYFLFRSLRAFVKTKVFRL